MSVCASVLLRLLWIPPCLFLAAAVCNRVPRVPVFMYVYSEEQKERTERQMKEQTNERNILNITKRPLTYSICDYEEQTSLCDLFSPFLLRMYLMGCPSSFLSLYGLSCTTQVTRKKKPREKRQNVLQYDASIQYRGRKKRRTIFFAWR